MTLEVSELTKRSYLRIIKQFIIADIKDWTFYPTSWVTNVIRTLVRVARFFFIAQLMIVVGHPFGENYFDYAMIARLSGLWLLVSLNSGHGTIRRAYWDRRLDLILLSPMPIVFYIFASSAWSYIMTTIDITISLALAFLFGFTLNLSGNLLFAVTAVFLSNAASFGYGLVAASNVFTMKAKAGGGRSNPTTMALHMLTEVASGGYYPLQFMPIWIQYISCILPHTFVYDALQRVFLPPETLGPLLVHTYFPLNPLITDLLILAIQCCILIPIGRYLLKSSVEKAQREGDLTRWV